MYVISVQDPRDIKCSILPPIKLHANTSKLILKVNCICRYISIFILLLVTQEMYSVCSHLCVLSKICTGWWMMLSSCCLYLFAHFIFYPISHISIHHNGLSHWLYENRCQDELFDWRIYLALIFTSHKPDISAHLTCALYLHQFTFLWHIPWWLVKRAVPYIGE